MWNNCHVRMLRGPSSSWALRCSRAVPSFTVPRCPPQRLEAYCGSLIEEFEEEVYAGIMKGGFDTQGEPGGRSRGRGRGRGRGHAWAGH